MLGLSIIPFQERLSCLFIDFFFPKNKQPCIIQNSLSYVSLISLSPRDQYNAEEFPLMCFFHEQFLLDLASLARTANCYFLLGSYAYIYDSSPVQMQQLFSSVCFFREQFLLDLASLGGPVLPIVALFRAHMRRSVNLRLYRC